MKKLIPIILVLALLLCSCGEPEPTAAKVKGADALYAEGVSAEMLSASFWTNDTTPLLTEAEIAYINEANGPYCNYTDENGETVTVRRADITDSISGKAVRGLIEAQSMPTAESYTADGELATQGFIDGIAAEKDLAAIPETVTPVYAICVKRDIAKCVPTDEPFYDAPDDYYYDMNTSAEVMPGDGVTVLHTSLSGKLVFIMADFYTGWLHTDSVAACESKAKWEEAMSPESFLTVTGYKITVEKPVTAKYSVDCDAYMGMKLRLADGKPESVDGRATYGAYCIELPARDESGMLCYVETTVSVNEDVTVGLLAPTPVNMVGQALKFSGHEYGWGGMNESNDCSGAVRQIWRCFGLALPRNTGEISKVTGYAVTEFDEDATAEARLETLKKLTPGSILYISGHTMVYLGTVDGEAFCLNSCGSFIQKSEKGKEEMSVTRVNCVCVNSMNVLRKTGKTWLESLIRVISPTVAK